MCAIKKGGSFDLLVDFWLNSYSESNFEIKLKLNYALNKNVLGQLFKWVSNN